MYGDFLMMVDHEIGRVIAALESASMLDNTLLVVERLRAEMRKIVEAGRSR